MIRKTRRAAYLTFAGYLLATVAVVFHYHGHDHHHGHHDYALTGGADSRSSGVPAAHSADTTKESHRCGDASPCCRHSHRPEQDSQSQRHAHNHGPHDHEPHPLPSDHDDCVVCQFLAERPLSVAALTVVTSAEFVESVIPVSVGVVSRVAAALPPVRAPPCV